MTDDGRDRKLNTNMAIVLRFLFICLVLFYVSRECVRRLQEQAVRCIQEKDINNNGERTRPITTLLLQLSVRTFIFCRRADRP